MLFRSWDTIPNQLRMVRSLHPLLRQQYVRHHKPSEPPPGLQGIPWPSIQRVYIDSALTDVKNILVETTTRARFPTRHLPMAEFTF